MNRILIIAPLIIFSALTIAFAVLLTRSEEIKIISKPLPGFSIEGLQSSQINGPALLNFFASWCTPCEAEHSTLVALKNDGVNIYGIAYKDEKPKTEAFLKRLGNPYKKIGHDYTGSAFIDFGLRGVPESFVIINGEIRYHHKGVLLNSDTSTIKRIMEGGQ